MERESVVRLMEDRLEEELAASSVVLRRLTGLSSSTEEEAEGGAQSTSNHQPKESDDPTKQSPTVGAMFCGEMLEEKILNSDGCTYSNDLHGIVLEVPAGAVPCDQPVTLSVGVSLYGSVVLPDARKSVSPILFLSTSPPVKLLKPAKLVLPHFLDVAGTTAAELGIVCLKAPIAVVNDSIIFNKEGVGACLENHCGTVYLDDLSTYVCLTRPDPSPAADRDVMDLYFIEDYRTQKIILPVVYALPTCRKHLEAQFEGLKVSLIGTFKLGAKGVIAIDHERQQDGWLFPLKKGKLITKDDVDYQNKQLDVLKRSERDRLYPPSYLIGAVRVSADATSTVLHIVVSVLGSAKFSVDVALPLVQKAEEAPSA